MKLTTQQAEVVSELQDFDAYIKKLLQERNHFENCTQGRWGMGERDAEINSAYPIEPLETARHDSVLPEICDLSYI